MYRKYEVGSYWIFDLFHPFIKNMRSYCAKHSLKAYKKTLFKRILAALERAALPEKVAVGAVLVGAGSIPNRL